jgi:signal transduction histidine kinase
VPDTIFIITLPVTTAVVAVLVWHNSARLSEALDKANVLNDALAGSRARLAAATDHERQRIERDLHDGTQQQLVALSLHLRLAEIACASDPDQAAGILRNVRQELGVAIDDLRNLARGIYPPILTDEGLGSAVAAACARTGAAVKVFAIPTWAGSPRLLKRLSISAAWRRSTTP